MSRLYVTRGRLVAVESSLSSRDWRVLATMGRLRLATSGHLERLHYGDIAPRRARQLLAGMVDRGLLARLPRVIGGLRAGSAGYVYTLDRAGSRLLRPGRTFRRPDDPGGRFLDHSLAISELYVGLVETHRLGTLTLASFMSEPACWRGFPGMGGGRVTLKPDCAVTTRLGRYEDRWLIEVDRATEAVSVVARKCELYRRYWQTGTEQARLGIFPRVLWVVPDKVRADALVAVFDRLPDEVQPLFAVVQAGEAVARIAQGAQL
jgi:Replication-relaxation